MCQWISLPLTGNLQYLGRSGTRGTVRYTAHDQGPAVEKATGQILAHFAKALKEEGSVSVHSGRLNMYFLNYIYFKLNLVYVSLYIVYREA